MYREFKIVDQSRCLLFRKSVVSYESVVIDGDGRLLRSGWRAVGGTIPFLLLGPSSPSLDPVELVQVGGLGDGGWSFVTNVDPIFLGELPVIGFRRARNPSARTASMRRRLLRASATAHAASAFEGHGRRYSRRRGRAGTTRFEIFVHNLLEHDGVDYGRTAVCHALVIFDFKPDVLPYFELLKVFLE